VTTPSRLLRAGLTPRPLERLVAGSWIEGSFSTWIGDPVKNRAWELLTRARSELSPFITADGKVPSPVHAALLAAEASDFFWWFGEPHSSAEDPLFDELFRAQLSAAYRAAGKTSPAALMEPLAPEPGAPLVRESRPIAPTLDGRMTDYFEWLGAGRFVVRAREPWAAADAW
jgi:alpha-amylase/alpha-mannosidase (GH57 family)